MVSDSTVVSMMNVNVQIFQTSPSLSCRVFWKYFESDNRELKGGGECKASIDIIVCVSSVTRGISKK